MRNLTQQEIDQAPDWATAYVICDDGDVCFESEESFTYLNDGDLKGLVMAQDAGMSEDAQPIPRKEFDISEYEFSDCDIESVEIDGYADNEYLHFDFKQETNELTHSKGDVIAMAKALKLTAEDLK